MLTEQDGAMMPADFVQTADDPCSRRSTTLRADRLALLVFGHPVAVLGDGQVMATVCCALAALLGAEFGAFLGCDAPAHISCGRE